MVRMYAATGPQTFSSVEPMSPDNYWCRGIVMSEQLPGRALRSKVSSCRVMC